MALADVCDAGEDDRSSMHPQASLSLPLSLSMHRQVSLFLSLSASTGKSLALSLSLSMHPQAKSLYFLL